jgi:guanine deaminase
MICSESDDVATYYEDALLLLTAAGEDCGRIFDLGPASEVAARYDLQLDRIEKSQGLLMPAFFDTHFHWVQDDVREMPKASLIEWLEAYTFPEESRYGDRAFAKVKADFFWKRILSVGTIGGLCYSSIHDVALEEAMRSAPSDFKIGNVLMTMNCPPAITQTEEEAKRSVECNAKKYADRYICTPRFAPTTAPGVMAASADVAAKYDCFQQTHLDETEQEIEWVLSIYRNLSGFEDIRHYTDIYSRVGMLGPKTVFGHCIYLDESEWELFAESGSRIASCPTSNAPIRQLGLGSGLFDFKKAESYGVPWALATDIGGGPFLSMFDVIRSFVAQNHAAGRFGATYSKALHRSTYKGAQLMDLGDERGKLAQGFYFDAIVVAMPEGDFRSRDAESVIEAVVAAIPSRAASDFCVQQTYIKGECCFSQEVNSCE